MVAGSVWGGQETASKNRKRPHDSDEGRKELVAGRKSLSPDG